MDCHKKPRYRFRHYLPCFKVIFKNIIKKKSNVTFIYALALNQELINSYMVGLS